MAGPMRGLLGRELGFESCDVGRMGCLDDRRPRVAIFPSMPTLKRLESDLADNAGEGGERSGSGMLAIDGRQ